MAAHQFEAIVVGAGFGGMHMLLRLRNMGIKARVLEQGSGVGGTWYWNRYPGARCDTETLEYSYGFDEALQQEWHWTEKYAGQPEIERYANHVADRFDLRKDIQFNTRVVSMVYDTGRELWVVKTESGETFECTYCITAMGCLSAPLMPDIAGRDDFKGELYFTSRWPKAGVDFKGKRVGIIGTGATGIQAIPEIAKDADHLFVFQRTPNFTLPARNGPLPPEEEAAMKARYAAHRESMRVSRAAQSVDGPIGPSVLTAPVEERERVFEERWQKGGPHIVGSYADLVTNEKANDIIAEFTRNKIRGIVKDPEVAEALCPKGYPFAAKRLSLDTNYYATFNRPNVTLVDIKKSPIERITATGIRTSDNSYDFDMLIFATGFDAVTGPLTQIEVRGKDGKTLKDLWAKEGSRSYLGLMVVGFPNLFTINGPGSPAIHVNVIFSIEQHVNWIADCLADMKAKNLKSIEPVEPAQEAWVAEVAEAASKTLYLKANSWYLGANIPGKPRVFMTYTGGLAAYRQKCDEVARANYDGFVRA